MGVHDILMAGHQEAIDQSHHGGEEVTSLPESFLHGHLTFIKPGSAIQKAKFGIFCKPCASLAACI